MNTREQFEIYLLNNGYEVHIFKEGVKVFVKGVRFKSPNLKFDAFCRIEFRDNSDNVLFQGLALGVCRDISMPIGSNLYHLISCAKSIHRLIAEAYSIASNNEILKHFEHNPL